ncbi:MAG: hypothetical protein NDI82_02575 [Anaeromyxobacteraceae bacterium]|nr:hypothetical protein [Anaeromyxobacteraceae bacterium]
MKTKSIVAALTLAVAGCATGGATPVAASGGTPRAAPAEVAMTDPAGRPYKVVCRQERPTGSNIPERVCRSAYLDDEARRQQDELLSPRARPVQNRTGR